MQIGQKVQPKVHVIHLRNSRGGPNGGECMKCGFKFPPKRPLSENDFPHDATNKLDKWEDANSKQTVNCLNPLASIIIVQES